MNCDVEVDEPSHLTKMFKDVLSMLLLPSTFGSQTKT